MPVLWCVPTMRSGRSGVPRRIRMPPALLLPLPPLSVVRSVLPMAELRLRRSPVSCVVGVSFGRSTHTPPSQQHWAGQAEGKQARTVGPRADPGDGVGPEAEREPQQTEEARHPPPLGQGRQRAPLAAAPAAAAAPTAATGATAAAPAAPALPQRRSVRPREGRHD